MAQSDEAEARHEGVVASLEERRGFAVVIRILGFSLTSWGTDLEE